MRNLGTDDPEAILAEFKARRDAYLATLRKDFPKAEISLEIHQHLSVLGRRPIRRRGPTCASAQRIELDDEGRLRVC